MKAGVIAILLVLLCGLAIAGGGYSVKLKAVVYISDTVTSMSSVPTYNVRFDLLLRDD